MSTNDAEDGELLDVQALRVEVFQIAWQLRVLAGRADWPLLLSHTLPADRMDLALRELRTIGKAAGVLLYLMHDVLLEGMTDTD
jgi:hypothetical protein